MMAKQVLWIIACSIVLAPWAVAQPPERKPDRRDGSREKGNWDEGRNVDRPPRGRGFPVADPIFGALDTDHDGILSSTELEQASKSLMELDQNGDGQLTRNELRPRFAPRGPGDGGPPLPDGARQRFGPDGRGNARRDRPRPPLEGQDRPRARPGDGAGEPPFLGRMMERLLSMDADGDGKLTTEELSERAKRLLDQADHNGDGAIDEEELRGVADMMRSRFRDQGRPSGRPAERRERARPKRPPIEDSPESSGEEQPVETQAGE